MVNLETGQRVMLQDGYGHDSQTQPGIVTKVGRVWCNIRREDSGETLLGERYRLDDQTDGSKYGSPPRFYTMDQWTVRAAKSAALKFLRNQGIKIQAGGKWANRIVELADLIKEHGRPEGAAQ